MRKPRLFDLAGGTEAARRIALVPVVAGLTALVVVGLSSCSDLLDTNKPDAVVSIPVEASRSIDEVRKEVKDETARLGGVRVGEDTTDPDMVVLEFMLPGKNLDAAVAMLERMDPESISTEINVDEQKLSEDTQPEPTDSTSTAKAKDEDAGRVRLKVEVTRETGSSGAVTALGALMLLFSLIGMFSSAKWMFRKLGLGGTRRDLPVRRVGRPDLDRDPPTEETPLVPPHW